MQPVNVQSKDRTLNRLLFLQDETITMIQLQEVLE